MGYIKVVGSGLIKLTGNYGYDTSTVEGLAAYTTIDATGASWIVSNSANQNPDADTSYSEGSGIINRFPFIVYSAGYGLTLKGGTIWGQVPQTSDWEYTYNDSAALRIEQAPAVTIDSWRIDKAWDAIRLYGGSDNFVITDVHLSNIRDDAVENEYVLSGTIRDSLFDGVFAGVSLGNGLNIDGSSHTLTLQNTFIRMETYLANGEMTHGSPIKANTDAPGTTPDIRIINSVIAIEDVTHNGFARLKLAWENVVESRGNVFLNLSDTPLPSNYPMPPAGFTILQGQAARDYWEKVEAAWLNNHDGTPVADVTPLPGQVASMVEPSYRAGDFNGDGRDDILWRHDSGIVTNWLANGSGGFASNYASVAINVASSWHIAGSGDFNGDGRDDLIWRHDGGAFTDWLGQANGSFAGNANANKQVATSWDIAGTGDFNGDGRDDIVWRHDSGAFTDWFGQANGGFATGFSSHVDSSWHVAGTGDFNGDGRDDILWRHDSGGFTDWLGQANGSFATGYNSRVDNSWHVAGTGDFNGDGRDDILWRHDNGAITEWLGQANGSFAANSKADNKVDPRWNIANTGDFNGDGRDDILWRHDNGYLAEWLGQTGGSFAMGIGMHVEKSWHLPSDFLI